MDQMSDAEFLKVVRNGRRSSSKKLADLASAFETYERPRVIAIKRAMKEFEEMNSTK